MDDELVTSPASSQRVISRRRGRKPAEFWVSFTTLEEPYKVRSAMCRHCNATVNYHKKWEQARSHLLKCEPFLKLMQGTDPVARPEWFCAEIEKRRRAAVRLLPIDLVARATDVLTDPSADTTVVFRPSMFKGKAPVQRTRKREAFGGVDGITISELLWLQAMHTGSNMDVEFLRAVLGRELNGGRTMQELVDTAHRRVRHCVHEILSGQPEGSLTLVVHWSEKRHTVEYRVASGDKCFFIEQCDIPDAVRDSGDASTSWLMQDIGRIIQSLELRVHHCVFQAPSALTDRVVATNGLDNSLSNGVEIRPSPLRALFELVDAVLQHGSASSNEDSNALMGWITIAQQCQDILRLLDVTKPVPSYLVKHLDATRHTVEKFRTISYAEALWAIIEADALLDVEAVKVTLTSEQVDKATYDAVISLVEIADFASKLQRSRTVLQPLYTALMLADKPVVHPSEVFVAYSSILRSYLDAGLTDSQKQFLTETVQYYKDRIVQQGDAQVHLLDPAYVGEFLDTRTKAVEEHDLFEMIRSDDPDEKQTLYVEYTQFQIAAVQQQTSGDGFVFRMLKERKKSMVQYWLTDGRRWPRLQAIALSLEQPPADVHLIEDTEVKPSLLEGSSDNVKELYLLKNTPLLSLSELTNLKPSPVVEDDEVVDV